ncbi:hypothetical protein [Agrococcus jejuensis]|uniref:hypothetical protein n=1 Tax=Agrococcus jejuensis TaxID=399736 RepID=UPI0012FAAA31|nr:hypothetical protein [Agrococcus jejuensis]
MVRRRWMRWGAVGAAAAVALTGCVGEDEPAPSPSAAEPSPSLSNDELADTSLDAYQGFQDELNAMYQAFDSDYTRLLPWSGPELATDAVASMEQTHATGLNIDGAPAVVSAEVESNDGDAASVIVCVDGSGVRVYDIESGVELEPSGDSPYSAWALAVVVEADGSVIVTSREARPDAGPSPCGSQP